MRKGNFINTFTNVKFYPLDPRVEDIKTVDIAHSLALLCRANGHCSHFYSVAQHSLNCAKEAEVLGYSAKIQLACLLHDASEAYISDLTRPVKRCIADYRRIEENLQNTIWKAYNLNLTEEEHKIIEKIDDALLSYEFSVLFRDVEIHSSSEVSCKYDLSFVEMEKVKQEFIKTITKLVRSVKLARNP